MPSCFLLIVGMRPSIGNEIYAHAAQFARLCPRQHYQICSDIQGTCCGAKENNKLVAVQLMHTYMHHMRTNRTTMSDNGQKIIWARRYCAEICHHLVVKGVRWRHVLQITGGLQALCPVRLFSSWLFNLSGIPSLSPFRDEHALKLYVANLHGCKADRLCTDN